MHLCSEGHGEVCHDERQCPVCEKMEKLNEQEDQITRLVSQLEDALIDAREARQELAKITKGE